jgi:thiamine-phosphate pyrophosphorylase
MTLHPPRICLVSDRRQLARRWGVPVSESAAALVRQIAAAAAAGVDWAVLREPDLTGREIASLVVRVVAAVAGTPMRVIVNDRLDVALATGAHGVHLREASFDAASVRRIAPPGFLVGRSVHDCAGVRLAGPVDYLLAGTVFPSASKPAGVDLLGTEGLRRLVAASVVPVLAIGGIDSGARVREVLSAGGAGVGVLGGLQPLPGGLDPVTGVQKCVRELQSGFDLGTGLS